MSTCKSDTLSISECQTIAFERHEITFKVKINHKTYDQKSNVNIRYQISWNRTGDRQLLRVYFLDKSKSISQHTMTSCFF